MPKVSVYLPDELYRAARDHGLSISALAQEAITAELAAARAERWVEAVRARAPRVIEELDVRAALDGAREEFGA